jgi:hypothetical protein
MTGVRDFSAKLKALTVMCRQSCTGGGEHDDEWSGRGTPEGSARRPGRAGGRPVLGPPRMTLTSQGRSFMSVAISSMLEREARPEGGGQTLPRQGCADARPREAISVIHLDEHASSVLGRRSAMLHDSDEGVMGSLRRSCIRPAEHPPRRPGPQGEYLPCFGLRLALLVSPVFLGGPGAPFWSCPWRHHMAKSETVLLQKPQLMHSSSRSARAQPP